MKTSSVTPFLFCLATAAFGCLEVPSDLVVPDNQGEGPCTLTCPPESFCEGDVATTQTANGAVTQDCQCDHSQVETQTDCSAEGLVCRDGLCVDQCGDLECEEGERCVAGLCQDPCAEVECEDGLTCQSGDCVDLCAGVDCDAPQDRCEDNDAVAFAGAGVCVNGTCDFSAVETRTSCGDQACLDGVCVERCADIDCSSSCDGAVAIQFTEDLGCDPQTGLCLEEPTRQDCGASDAVCLDGQCLDLCDGVSCPDVFTCDGNTALVITGSECDPQTGACDQPTPLETDCGDDICTDGECRPQPLGQFSLISSASFIMGSQNIELGRLGDEVAHTVLVTRDFFVQQRETTQEQWSDLMVENPSFHSACGRQCPVERVTWFETIVFSNLASAREGLPACYRSPMDETPYDLDDAAESVIPTFPDGAACTGYRLPTEAEWEMAARAGQRTAFFNGDITSLDCGTPDPNLEDIAFFSCNSEGRIHTGGLKDPSQAGLHDTQGNASEWVWDRYGDYDTDDAEDPIGPDAGNERVARGGSWKLDAGSCRAAKRFRFGPANRENDVGLRLVRTAPDQ